MKKIWTIGHSTRDIEEFLSLLKEFEIEVLIDVRSYPGSRRYPHFNKENLQESLKNSGIGYTHIKELGGRRKPNPESKNTAWRNSSFRAYADHMETDEFKKGVEILTNTSSEKRSAVMCSEAVWWRCHRSMISDYLKAADWEVIHIISENNREEHPYTKPAKVRQGNLFYDE